MGMQTGHKALCQIICDYLCQGTTYTGIDGQDYLSSFQMQKDKKYNTDIKLMIAAQVLDRDIFYTINMVKLVNGCAIHPMLNKQVIGRLYI